MKPQTKIHKIYQTLLKAYGRQGWWPISVNQDSQNKECDSKGYHPGVYHIPTDENQKLEICVGAILTQNTNWNNAVSALDALARAGLFSRQALLHGKTEQIALAIKSAGYYNQKAKYLNNLVHFLEQLPFQKLESQATGTVREKLLEISGIGPETADCILLYALKKPSFVVDAYTRRIFSGLGMVSETVSYHSLKALFESTLKKDLIVYQEYHALLVHHGKRYYSKKPYGKGDVLLRSL